jgi:hypothetical protein
LSRLATEKTTSRWIASSQSSRKSMARQKTWGRSSGPSADQLMSNAGPGHWSRSPRVWR